jgi:hypothetical protein
MVVGSTPETEVLFTKPDCSPRIHRRYGTAVLEITKSSLLIENGGPNTFGASWASRCASCDDQEERGRDHRLRRQGAVDYETCLTLALDEHTVPDCMVCNKDIKSI